MHFSIIHLDTVDSTNSYLKSLAEKGVVNGTVVTAKKQTAGRGKWQRHWHSPEESLSFSLLIRNTKPEEALHFQFVAAVALIEYLKQCHPTVTFSLKWPNDILGNGKKIAGILVEATENYAIIGIGLNVNTKQFPKSLEGKASSLALLCSSGVSYDLAQVLNDLLKAFATTYENYTKKDFAHVMTTYNNHWEHRGKSTTIVTGTTTIQGIGKHIDNQGHLVLQTTEGLVTLDQGETSFEPITSCKT